MSFIEELKRRNVFRVGIAYGIASWVLLQIADLVLENIGSPPWVIQTLMFLVGLGFVAALIIAWAYELTPEGIKREADVVRDDSITQHTGKKLNAITLAAVLILLVIMVLDRFVFERPGSGPISKETPGPVAKVVPAPVELELEPAAKVDEKSIAVLPFVDMSPEGDQAYFADGIAEEILNVLVKTRSLKVAGRTSSFQFRNRNEDLRIIGQKLGVEHILEGSIRKAGNRLRITAQLVKASDGFHLWSETYDRELDDVFAIQDEIARAITKALAIELNLDEGTESLAPVQTTNMVAYDKYLEARALLTQRSDFLLLIKLLEEATTLDPAFAEGWATLAQAHALSFYYDVAKPDEAIRQAEKIARRAIELDPALSTAHSALADSLRDQALWNEAWDSYHVALDLNPDNGETHLQFGQMLIRLGHVREALVHGARAVEIDPLSWINQLYRSNTLFVNGFQDAAWQAMNKAEVLSDFSRSLVVRFKLRMALTEGMNDVARQTVKIFADHPNENEGDQVFHFIPLIEMLDQPQKAREYMRGLNLNEARDISSLMFWAAYFDDLDLADSMMEAGLQGEVAEDMVDFGLLDATWLNFRPVDPLFALPNFKLLSKKGQMDIFWRVHGWPEYCRPISESDFECGIVDKG